VEQAVQPPHTGAARQLKEGVAKTCKVQHKQGSSRSRFAAEVEASSQAQGAGKVAGGVAAAVGDLVVAAVLGVCDALQGSVANMLGRQKSVE